ncbi:hypothetical protein H2199_005569 [Coniosporium tulheliwenetii]|uniref:Uncharacterized protein n=1 Tax=Coniosporium tulheliwenetii TaxID=3383036 RepID=A0ACC2Z060_9PEZI|nr:hypothetical protein H2199_005569 [Cladosporium sp. JES 115]
MAFSTNAEPQEVQPRSTHVADPTLLPFIQPTFDVADYFNTTLPSLSLSSSAAPRASRQPSTATSASLQELSSQTQTLLAQLNAQTARLSNTLTQLTDDILRSGGRLAYRVEVLRGETLGLSEALTDGLQDDVRKFVPGGVTVKAGDTPAEKGNQAASEATDTRSDPAKVPESAGDAPTGSGEVPFISQLRTLTLVRARLESVIKVFGEAMQWTLPPSEVSLASSLISVSAPEPGSDSHSREEKGREFAEKLRNEISDLLTGGSTDAQGLDAAISRIDALRELATVWKGTAEEKARVRFVESLIKLVEDRQKALGRGQAQPSAQSAESRRQTANRAANEGGGFLQNLQRMRGNIYLE